LYLLLHTPFSCSAPKTHLSILLSNTLNNLSSVFDGVQVSGTYCNKFAGSISQWKFITLKAQYATVEYSSQLF
jgi:hypothetical protein